MRKLVLMLLVLMLCVQPLLCRSHDTDCEAVVVVPLQKGKGLSGDIPSFRGAEGLRALRLNRNSFTGQLPSLPAGIREVRVQQNQLRGPVPPGYGDLEQLHTLKAESNKLSGSIPSGALFSGQELSARHCSPDCCS